MEPEQLDDAGRNDEQDVAELYDEEARGEDLVDEGPPPADGYVHGVLGAPDQLGADAISELVAVEYPIEDPLGPEERALHYEPRDAERRG